MSRSPVPEELLDETTAPPRKNGELVFEAPWESRAFGMAVVLRQRNAYTWLEFSDRLAAEIRAQDRKTPADQVLPVPPDTNARYYQQWLASLEKLVLEKEIVSAAELEARTEEFAVGMWDHEH